MMASSGDTNTTTNVVEEKQQEESSTTKPVAEATEKVKEQVVEEQKEEKNEEDREVKAKEEKKETTEEKEQEIKEVVSVETTMDPLAAKNSISKAWKKVYKDEKKYYVSSEYLKENASYYIGNVVVTVVEVGKVKSDCFKVSSGLVTSYEVDMAETSDLEFLSKGESVAIIGKVKEISSVVEAVIISDAYILAAADVSEYTEKIDGKMDEQKQYIKQKKKDEKEAAIAAVQKEMDKYKKECVWPDYEQVQRKPKKYKGTKTYIVGEAIQVSEGLFDNVTLRVTDGDGNTWLVSHSYSEDEDRILEGDYIQIWGECTGTTTYETVLGSSVTIPSIDAKYIEPSYS